MLATTKKILILTLMPNPKFVIYKTFVLLLLIFFSPLKDFIEMVVPYGTVWYGTVRRYGMVWYGMTVWYGMVGYSD